jgi:hypothetical protein
MDTIKTAAYNFDRKRKKGRNPSAAPKAANAPSTLPGATALCSTALSRIIEDSLSDLTEAVSPVPVLPPIVSGSRNPWRRRDAG